jgi:hypothetical protein
MARQGETRRGCCRDETSPAVTHRWHELEETLERGAVDEARLELLPLERGQGAQARVCRHILRRHHLGKGRCRRALRAGTLPRLGPRRRAWQDVQHEVVGRALEEAACGGRVVLLVEQRQAGRRLELAEGQGVLQVGCVLRLGHVVVHVQPRAAVHRHLHAQIYPLSQDHRMSESVAR